MFNPFQMRVPDRLSDYLPWAGLVGPGIMMNKDGSFQCTIRYRGPDLESATDDELVSTSARLNHIFLRHGLNWAFFMQCHRTRADEYPRSVWDSPAPYLIDKEKEAEFASGNHFESVYHLTLLYLPPSEITDKVAGAFFCGEDGTEASGAKHLEYFRVEIDRTVGLLEKVFPEVRKLNDEETLTYLHSCISTKRHRVKVPDVPMYLDAILPDVPLVGGLEPRLGDQYLGVVTVLGYPSFSEPDILEALNHLPIEYRWCTRYICMDKESAKHTIGVHQKKWLQQRKGFGTLLSEKLLHDYSGRENTDAVNKARDADEALQAVGADCVSFGYLTSTVVVMAETKEELKAKLNEVERCINGSGFVTIRESINAVEAFLGTVPGETRRNPRARHHILSTLNLAHLMPGASAPWAGQKWDSHFKAPALFLAETYGSTPFRYVLHDGDVGHCMVLGPTGAGKSTLLSFMAAQFLRYENAQVYIFDIGGSARALCAGVGGDFYDLLGEENDLYFQPLRDIDVESELKWAHGWVLDILIKENITITPHVQGAVWDALRTVAKQPRQERTIFSLTVALQSQELRDALNPYTQRGPHGKLLDSNCDNLRAGHFQVFEMEKLMKSQQAVVPVLSYLFHQIERRLEGDKSNGQAGGNPTLIILDEGWVSINHPQFSQKIEEWLRTCRKKNASVIFASQSLSDVEQSSLSSMLKEACLTKIFLPNAAARTAEGRRFYKDFGLNDRQIQILEQAAPKRDYYYTSKRLGNRLFSLNLGAVALAYCSGASAQLHALVTELQAEHKDLLEYNAAFLDAKGLRDVANAVIALKQTKEAA